MSAAPPTACLDNGAVRYPPLRRPTSHQPSFVTSLSSQKLLIFFVLMNDC